MSSCTLQQLEIQVGGESPLAVLISCPRSAGDLFLSLGLDYALWDGKKEHEFIISGRSDSDYAKDTQTQKSISGYRVLLEGAPVMFMSSTQKSVALSVCEAEQTAGVLCAQDM
jgi:hypothetical protein